MSSVGLQSSMAHGLLNSGGFSKPTPKSCGAQGRSTNGEPYMWDSKLTNCALYSVFLH